MRLTLKDDLPFVTVVAGHGEAELEISHILVDTGSASTMLAADIVARIGIVPEPGDVLHAVRGIGGSEAVFSRRIDWLRIDQQSIQQFEVEVGAWTMDSRSTEFWGRISSSVPERSSI